VTREAPGPAGTSQGTPPPTVSAQRTIATASGALIVSALPMFLLGALSGRIGADLQITGTVVGGLVALFFTAGAVSSIPAGHLTDRIGSTAALRTAAVIAATCSLGVAGLGTDVWVLLVLFILGGTAIAMADTGGARAIAASIPSKRQGIAFGGKEASIPAASMLAGLAVPILGAQFGWRPAFALAGGLAVAFLLVVPRGLGPSTLRPSTVRPSMRRPTELRPSGHASPPMTNRDAQPPQTAGTEPGTGFVLLLLAIAAGLGGAAATATPTFLVPAAMAGGLGESPAGFLLAGASITGIGVRLSAGVLVDRASGAEIRFTAWLLALGTIGLIALSFGGTIMTMVGAILAIGGGWGWTGLIFLAAVRTQPSRPAGAAGTVLAGLGTGGAAGPITFGWLADGPGYPTAWLTAGIAMFIAAGIGLLADHRRRQLG
jgi:predicted MFS family arabinose efflux permease